jgi:hypothetical protein
MCYRIAAATSRGGKPTGATHTTKCLANIYWGYQQLPDPDQIATGATRLL